jgi:hypothetical protein
LHYLGNIKKGLLALAGGDEQALKRFDRPTITALESRAPGASTADAQFLRNQGRAIFSAFTDHERDQILDRLPMVDGLLLTLSSFFKDLNYLQLLIDCLKRLVIVPKRRSVCETIQSKYTGVNQQEGQVKIQVTEDAEDTFVYKSGTDADRVDLGWRQLVALAMRYYPYMPRDPIKEDAVRKATTRADHAVLRLLADLAYQLGFKTPQIYALREHSSSRIAGDDDPHFPPLHVTSGCGIEMRQRSGIPRTKAYKEDRYSLFINHLHDTQAYQDEGITSFFVRKSVYLAFFGRPDEASSSSAFDSPRIYPNRPPRHDTSQSQGRRQYRDNDIDDIVSSYNRRENTSELLPNQERLEQERRDQDRREQERQEEERREEERREEERREEERRELRRLEETLEREDVQERLAQALQAQENLRQQNRRQQEHEKQEQEREEEERRRQEIRERGRREQEALVQGRPLNDPERARKRHTQIDMESLVSSAVGNQTDVSAAGQAQEQEPETASSDIQSGRELVAADPSLNTARNLQELERERQDQDRREEERLEQERQEQERLEQERQEQERLELRRIEERLEREDLQERLAQALEAQQNLEQEKQRQQQHERQEQEREEEERRRQETRERGRREQEALVQGRTLDDSERARKRHTQIDMESLVSDARNQRDLPAAGLQTGRELVVADPSSNTVRNLQRLEQERLEQERLERERLEQERLERLEQERLEQERLERERLEQERLEQERLEQERLEQERLEQERLEQERLERERLERKKLQESFAQKLREQEKLDQEKQEQKKREQEQKKREQEQEKRELDRRKGERQRRERREQGRWEQEKTIESEGGLAAESTKPRPQRRQVGDTLHHPFQRAHFCRIQLRWLRRQTPSGLRSTFGNEAFGGPLKVSMYIPLIHPRSSE